MDSNTFYILTIGHCLAETFWERGLSFAPPKTETDEMDHYQQVKYVRVLIIVLAWIGITGFIYKYNNLVIITPVIYLIANSIIFNVSYIFPREATIVYGMGFAIANMVIRHNGLIGKVMLITMTVFMYYIIQLITSIHIYDDIESEKMARHIMTCAICTFILSIHLNLIKNKSVIDILQSLSYLGIFIYNYYLI